MPRFSLPAVIAAAAAFAAPLAHAGEAGQLLSWPGKAGSAAPATTAAPEGPTQVSLSKQFFGGASDDLAAPPAPLPPRSVPGTPAISNPSTINTASNRARATQMLTADSASDGPVAGVQSPD